MTEYESREEPVKSLVGSESGGVQSAPRVSAAIARAAAEEAVRAVADVSTGLVRDLEVDASRQVLPQPCTPSEQLALLYDETPPPPAPTVAGIPGAADFWRATTMEGVAAISVRLWERTDLCSEKVRIIGPYGSPAERLEQVRACIAHEQAFVSIALCGSLKRLLVTGNPWAASVSVLAKMPGEPIAAAVATVRHALAADCSDAYRLLLPEGEWKVRSEDDVLHPAAPGYVILPSELRGAAEPLLERFYKHPDFVDDTASAIAEALLSNHVPLAVHYGGHILEAAVVLVAAAHGFVVRPLVPGGTVLRPWQCTRLLTSALTSGVGIPRLVLGRDEVNAKNLTHHLGHVPLATS
jgi:hypothetical protein